MAFMMFRGVNRSLLSKKAVPAQILYTNSSNRELLSIESTTELDPPPLLTGYKVKADGDEEKG